MYVNSIGSRQCFGSGSLSHGSGSDHNDNIDPDPSDYKIFFKENNYTK